MPFSTPSMRSQRSQRREQGEYGQPLSDPGWRKWFDILANEGVSEIGFGSSFEPMAMSSPVASRPGYSQREMPDPFQEKPLPESHDSFMRGAVSDSIKGIRRVAGRR